MITFMMVGRMLKDYAGTGDVPHEYRRKCTGCGEDLAFSPGGAEQLENPGEGAVALPVCNGCMYNHVTPGMEFRVTEFARQMLARDDSTGEMARAIMKCFREKAK